MLKENDIKLLMHLRKNARKKITDISYEENVPVTTLYDRLRVYERKYLKKHTSLIDFRKLGFNSIVHIAIKVSRDKREKLQDFLMNNSSINSLYRINNGHDFLAECIFKDVSKQHEFLEDLQNYDAETVVYEQVNELRKEEFLTNPEVEL